MSIEDTMRTSKISLFVVAITCIVLAASFSLNAFFPVDQSSIGMINASMHNQLTFEDTHRGTNPDAVLEIVSFESFTCPFSVQLYPIMKRLMQLYPDVNFIMKHAIDMTDQREVFAAVAYECARIHGRGYDLADYLYSEHFTEQSIIEYAKTLDLGDEFLACTQEEDIFNLVLVDAYHGSDLNVRGTPTVFLNGIRIEGVQSFELYSSMLDRELEAQQ